MSEDILKASPPQAGSRFRAVIGLLAVLGGLTIVVLLIFVSVPASNRDAIMLALGLVLGWGGTIVGFEFGSSPAGRKAAEAGLRTANLQPEPGAEASAIKGERA